MLFFVLKARPSCSPFNATTSIQIHISVLDPQLPLPCRLLSKSHYPGIEAPAVIKSYYDKRIVGCLGSEGEDEHNVVWFWLEKGKPHECPVCSQYVVILVLLLHFFAGVPTTIMWSLAFCWLWSLERSFFDEGPIYAIPFITVNNTKNGKKMKQMKIQRLIEYSHFDYGLRSELARTSHPRQRRKEKADLNRLSPGQQQVIHLLTEKRDALIPAPPVDERSPLEKMNESSSLEGEQAVPSPLTALLKALWSDKLTAANQGTVLEEEKKAFYQAKRRLEDAKKEAGLAAVRQLAAQGGMPGLGRGFREGGQCWSAELELSKQARRINRRRLMPRLLRLPLWTWRWRRSAAAKLAEHRHRSRFVITILLFRAAQECDVL
ncbi:hypothetical protein K1719_022401 [Acacia pycnantha]|nr:hypothetical protein K1719_022401 [Acacia pycnantha]